MSPREIVIIANDTTYVYNLRRELICGLTERGDRVTVVGELRLFREELEAMQCRLIDVQTLRHGTNPVKDLCLLGRYIRVLRSIRPDAVLTYNIKPNVYAGMACRLLGLKYFPNITGLGTAVENPGRMQKLTTRLYKWGVAKARCVFFQNTENEAFFRGRKMLNACSRTCLLPGSGVSLDTHPVLPYPEEEKTHFLFVARVLKEKGIDQYLAAARAVRAKRQDVAFHICGGCDDPAYEQILRQAQEENIVVYHGQQKHMRPFFEQAACIVHPSYYPEGMSNVLLEAAASGRPVITTNRSGCRETVEHGSTGFVVPIKDEAALTEALEQFLSLGWEERRDMGLAGREKMEKEFDRKIVVAHYLRELEEVQK